MAWETRGNRRYLYRSRRIDGQVKKFFLGTGAVAETHERLIAEERRRREAERLAWQAELSRLACADALLDELKAAMTLLTAAVLIVTGYHEHHRQWRLCREKYNARRKAHNGPCRAACRPGDPGRTDGPAQPGGRQGQRRQ